MSKKKGKAFYPTTDLMREAFELIEKSGKYIVIGEYFDGTGLLSVIHHETDGPADTAAELRSWASFMEGKAQHQDELKDILGESGIEEF